jgi:hypothetical protein
MSRQSATAILIALALTAAACGGGEKIHLSGADLIAAGKACDVLKARNGLEGCKVTEVDREPAQGYVGVEIDTEDGHRCVYFNEEPPDTFHLINVKAGQACGTQT